MLKRAWPSTFSSRRRLHSRSCLHMRPKLRETSNSDTLPQSRYVTPSTTPRTEAANPFSRTGGAESLLDALSKKLNVSKTPGGSSPSTPASNGGRNYQTTHNGSNAAQPRVQRRSSRSSHRAASRSLSSSRHDPSHHSSIKWHYESNPHVSFGSTFRGYMELS